MNVMYGETHLEGNTDNAITIREADQELNGTLENIDSADLLFNNE